MTVRTNETLTPANRIKETNMSEFITDRRQSGSTARRPWRRGVSPSPARRATTGSPSSSPLTSTAGMTCRYLGAVHGLDLQIRFPREGWPAAAAALFVALDELLLDVRGRREYLARLRTLKLPFPIIVLSYDFYLDPPTLVRPGSMLAVRLDDQIFGALRKGHIDPPADEDEGHKAA